MRLPAPLPSTGAESTFNSGKTFIGAVVGNKRVVEPKNAYATVNKDNNGTPRTGSLIAAKRGVVDFHTYAEREDCAAGIGTVGC